LLNPYALLMGVTVVLLFAMHGGRFTFVMKTEGELHENRSRLGAADHRPLPGGLISLQFLHAHRVAAHLMKPSVRAHGF